MCFQALVQKTEKWLKMLLKCPKWASEDFGVSTLTELKIIIFTDITTLKGWKDIFWAQTFQFFSKIFEFVCFPPIFEILRKKGIIFTKFRKILWETDKLKFFLENRQSECFCLTKIFFGNIRPIEKKLCHFFTTYTQGGGE